MNTREHWKPREQPDLHMWIHESSDMAIGQRINERLDYLRWLHRAVAWERFKERVPGALKLIAVLFIPGAGLILGARYLYNRRSK